MSIGTGVSTGQDADILIGIRPGDIAYENHTGAVFHEQDESNNLNVPYYEIQNTGDEIDINLRPYIFDMAQPVAVFYTTWGPTDFDIRERSTGETVIAEKSGFDNTGWVVDVSATDGKLRITEFDTNQGVTGTQASWYPFVDVFDRI